MKEAMSVYGGKHAISRQDGLGRSRPDAYTFPCDGAGTPIVFDSEVSRLHGQWTAGRTQCGYPRWKGKHYETAKKRTQKSPKSATATGNKPAGCTDEERGAMRERVQELKAEARRAARRRGERGERGPRKDRPATAAGSRHGRAAPCDHQSQRASPLVENLVRDARLKAGIELSVPL
jgi:hypothetical protein